MMSQYEILTNQNPIPYINSNEPLFCDIETHGLYLEVCLFQMYQEGWAKPVIIVYPIEDKLKDLIQNNYTVWYNASYDLGTLEISPDKYDDLFYAAKTAYPLLDGHALDEVEEALGITVHDFINDIKEHLGNKYPKGMKKTDMQKSFASAKCKKARDFTSEQLLYAAADTIGLAQMWTDRKIRKVIRSNEAYAADIAAQKDALIYQYNGMPVDKDRLTKVKAKAQRNVNKHLRALPRDLNVNSSKQVPIFLNTADAKAPTLKKLILEDDNKDAEHILEAKKSMKQITTLEIYNKSERINTFFNAAGAVTGRFTSVGGDREGYTNIQQIPRNLKKVFGYPEDHERILINADYGTAELIAGCAIFKVPSLREEILDGLDLHKATATWLANVSYDKVTKKQRQDAKPVNFGFLFGMGIELFMTYAYDTYGVKFTRDEAERAKALYYRTHPGIKEHHQYTGRMCKKSDYTVKTALGRVKGNERYTVFLNIPIQGSIAESTKIAINHFIINNKNLLKENKIINMVHDSIVGDIHKKYIDEWSEAIKKSMQYGWKQVSKSDLFHYHDLPMGVDVEVSHEYGDEYEPEKVKQIIKAYK